MTTTRDERTWRVTAVACVGVLLWLASVSSGVAQTLDDYVRRQMERHRIPGMAVVVARGGTVLDARGYGLANVEHRTPVTPDTVFEIASVTKPITAIGVLLLVQDGRIELDRPISTYLDSLPATWSAITTRHLLSHTSGLKDYLNDRLVDRQRDQTSRELLEAVFSSPLLFSPGARWSYSNTNYLALELLIQGLTQAPFERFLTDRVFRASGMTTTGRRQLRPILPGRAAHYDLQDGSVVNATYLNPTIWDHGDGGLVSSALDLYRFDAALAGGGLIEPGLLQQAWTGPRLESGERASYGLGWELGDVNGVRYVGHSGGRAGVSSIYLRFIDADLTVIVLSNLSGVNLRRDLANGIAGLYDKRLRSLDDREPSLESGTDHRDRALAFLRDVADGKRDSALVTPGNRQAVGSPQRSLAGFLANRESFENLGCDAVVDLERRGTAIARVCHYRLLTGTQLVHLSLYLSREGQVADQVVEVKERPARP